MTAIGAADTFKREINGDTVCDADTVVFDARELGELLAKPALHQPRGGFTLAKLIGRGVQDLAAVETALTALNSAER